MKIWKIILLVLVVLLIILSGIIYLHPGLRATLEDKCDAMFDTESSDGQQLRKGYNVYGIDISKYQGKMDWDSVAIKYNPIIGDKTEKDVWKEKSISFVFVRASYGNMRDGCYAHHIKKAHKKGLYCGSYHVFTNTTPVDAQVTNFVEAIKLRNMDLPPVLDIENDFVQRPLDQYRKRVLTWLKKVEKMCGIRPIIYASDNCKRDVLNTPEFNKYDFWIARYTTDQPKHCYKWRFWQYTEKGKVKGLKGKVDINVYRGTKGQLKSWLRDTVWAEKNPSLLKSILK